MLAIVALAQFDAVIISKFASTCLDIHGDMGSIVAQNLMTHSAVGEVVVPDAWIAG